MEIIAVIVIMLVVLVIQLHRAALTREADERWQAEDLEDRNEEWEALGVWAREHPRKARLPRLESLRETRKGKLLR
jgi:hypothetical protein